MVVDNPQPVAGQVRPLVTPTAANGAVNGAPAAPAANGGTSTWQTIGRMVLFWWIIQLVMRGTGVIPNNATNGGAGNTKANADFPGAYDEIDDDTNGGIIPRGNEHGAAAVARRAKQQHKELPHPPAWRDGQSFEMYLYLSTNETLDLRLLADDDRASQRANKDNGAITIDARTGRSIHSTAAAPVGNGAHRLLWQQHALRFDWETTNERAINLTFNNDVTPIWWQTLQSNGSIYTHAYFVRIGASLVPGTHGYDRRSVTYGRSTLNIYRVQPKISRKVNLMTGEAADPRFASSSSSSPSLASSSSAPHALPDASQAVIDGGKFDDYEPRSEPSSVGSSSSSYDIVVSTEPRIPSSSSDALPIVSHWRPTLTLRLVQDQTMYPPGLPAEMIDLLTIDQQTGAYLPVVYYDYFWLLARDCHQINDSVTSLNLSLSYSPISMFKWRMQLQMADSWRIQQSHMGSSERESEEMKRMMIESNLYLLAVTMVVSVLHMVFDALAFKNDIAFWKNKKSMVGLSVRTIMLNVICQAIIFLYLCDNDTSWMILGSSGVGLLIEIWKIRKSAVVSIDRTLPFPYIKWKEDASYEASGTSSIDAEAMKYLSWALFPCVIGYSIYSLYYESHKSWYSWVLGTLVGSVYTFGFIMMCPQLYINYRLKSVAHLPWRMLTYKALNTFIDDLFAFVITMPTMHRLSCFRDDIIFFIFIYQKWKYRTDYSRVNEFGWSQELADQKKAEEEKAVTDAATAGAVVHAVTNDDNDDTTDSGNTIKQRHTSVSSSSSKAATTNDNNGTVVDKTKSQ